jgi:hypothetical protein
MAPTYRAWQKAEIETIYKVMKEHAPWRGPKPWEDAEFMAAWLNNFQLIEQESGNPTSEEELITWWKSTEEYQNEWPKWEEGQHPNPPVIDGIVGQLRVNGGGYADDKGPVLPIGLHLGDIFSKYTRDQGHARRYLETASGAGYRIIQFWMNLGTLGGSYWAGREVGPHVTPDYFGQLKGVYNLGDYRLASLSHDSFWQQVNDILQSRDTAAFAFGGNEAWQTGANSGDEVWDSLEHMQSGVIKTSTAPPSEERSDIESWCRGNFYAIHGYRGGEDHDRLRHIFSVPWEGNPPTRYGYQDEWTGPGSVVSVKPPHCYNGRDVDANHMCAGAFQSLMCNQAFNYFCSEGVKSDGDITQRAGFFEVPKVATFLPLDLMSWDNPIHFGATQARRIFEPVSGNAVRFDHRIAPDGRFVGLLYGDQGQARIRNVRPCELSILNWDGSVERTQRFNRGDELVVDLVRSQNGQPGRTALPITGKI